MTLYNVLKNLFAKLPSALLHIIGDTGMQNKRIRIFTNLSKCHLMSIQGTKYIHNYTWSKF